MPQVASVRLRYASQDYWFDPAGLEVKKGDHVLVETSKGEEIGLCTEDVVEVDSSELSKPLKPVVRIATEDDLKKSDELVERAQQALATFRELVEKHNLDMSPAAVEFMFDESHATFYFTSDDRIDFRSLVRDLAAEFHVHVDMRQIGVRDEARMLGGLGHCGQELCCAAMGGEFKPVSIRMAKEQDLPLNPTKISGLCGRLMCCLRYEYEAYKDFKSRAPKKGGIIDTPAGLGKVVEFDTPRETVRLRMEDGSSLTLPVSALDTGDKVAREGERIRPCHISQEKFDQIIEELKNDTKLAMMGDKLFSDDPSLADATADAGAIEHVQRRKRKTQDSSGHRAASSRGPRKRGDAASEPKPRDERKRRRSVSATEGAPVNHAALPSRAASADSPKKVSEDATRPRRRRHRGGKKSTAQAGKQHDQQTPKDAAPQKPSRARPGQHSSSVSGDAASGTGQNGSNGSGSGRRRRRRSGNDHGGSGSKNNVHGTNTGKE